MGHRTRQRFGGREDALLLARQPMGGFLSGENLMKVSISGGAPTTIDATGMNVRGASFGPDGAIVFASQRFVMVGKSETEEPAPTQLNLVLNWGEELKRLAPTSN